MEAEEEEILTSGGQLKGSMIGRRRILTTWAVGEAWEIFTSEQIEVVKKSFHILGLALPIDGTCDQEISIKGLDSTYLQEGIKNWERRESIPPVVDCDDNDTVELAEVDDDEEDVHYEELY
ncbi:hypothetical protein HOY82DRAFT_540914 [Tuber indicum]|nr:hypothetical protein HOY82DRAFT_540914 [Tuber indicum]